MLCTPMYRNRLKRTHYISVMFLMSSDFCAADLSAFTDTRGDSACCWKPGAQSQDAEARYLLKVLTPSCKVRRN